MTVVKVKWCEKKKTNKQKKHWGWADLSCITIAAVACQILLQHGFCNTGVTVRNVSSQVFL